MAQQAAPWQGWDSVPQQSPPQQAASKPSNSFVNTQPSYGLPEMTAQAMNGMNGLGSYIGSAFAGANALNSANYQQDQQLKLAYYLANQKHSLAQQLLQLMGASMNTAPMGGFTSNFGQGVTMPGAQAPAQAGPQTIKPTPQTMVPDDVRARLGLPPLASTSAPAQPPMPPQKFPQTPTWAA